MSANDMMMDSHNSHDDRWWPTTMDDNSQRPQTMAMDNNNLYFGDQ